MSSFASSSTPPDQHKKRRSSGNGNRRGGKSRNKKGGGKGGASGEPSGAGSNGGNGNGSGSGNGNAAPMSSTTAAAQSSVKFRDIVGISDCRMKSIDAMGFEYMTDVQAQTLPVIMEGKDTLAKAKTGTGKTLAFCIPALEIMGKTIGESGSNNNQDRVLTLALSPTRELATQISVEASRLTKFEPYDCNIVVCIGGTNIKADQKRLGRGDVHLLIATPGRLIDHLENTPGFARKMSGLKTLIFDEADQLLEMGFKPEIDKVRINIILFVLVFVLVFVFASLFVLIFLALPSYLTRQ